MGYETLSSAGSYTGYKDLYIRLYANVEAVESDLRGNIEHGFSEVLEELRNVGAINYWQITLCDEYFEISYSDKSDYLKKFKKECEDRGYDAHIGAHVGAGTGMTGGVAYTGSGYSSFKQPTYSVFNCEGLPNEYEKNVSIQEAFHGVIDSSLPGIYEYTAQEGEGDADHDLGMVYNDGSVSPMATGYEDTHARHGQCANYNSWMYTYKALFTSCAEDAVEINAEEYS